MTKLTERELRDMCERLYSDRETICKHNPIGTQEEILLWMLMGCLISYLGLEDVETPCFAGMPNAQTYYDAIVYILKERRREDFDAEPYLNELLKK